MTYSSGGNQFTLYSTYVHQCKCKLEPGSLGYCVSPDSGYLTGPSGVPLHQDCEIQVCSVSSIESNRMGVLALATPVKEDYRPEATGAQPAFRAAPADPDYPVYIDHDFIEFQPDEGEPMILAKVFHYTVPRHTHPSTHPGKEFRAYPITFGFQCERDLTPPPISDRVEKKEGVYHISGTGPCLYHVRSKGQIYGIVVVGP